jgi:hypothetical protein
MNEPTSVNVGATFHAPVSSIRKVASDIDWDFRNCEANVHIGAFFDGTGNSMEHDAPRLTHNSNIVRLHDSYSDQTELGYYPFYIPGVGTRFPAVGEDDESDLGAGFAIGCESRVLFGLLAVFNSLHRRVFPKTPLFNPDQIRALCRNRTQVDFDDRMALESLGMSAGLLRPSLIGKGAREAFLQREASALCAKLAKSKPRVVGCFVDVFGFSRGAAEARVFCNWLDQLLIGGKLAGVPLRIRFVGLMDTVASAGFWSGATGSVTSGTGGHSGWASPEFLRLPGSVENCVHMVAMHELRRNFPLDEVGINGVMPAGCHEYAYPGAHSDVGGGYAPGQLGVSVGKNAVEGDALKLSQIPLNHMFECAVAAGAPLDKSIAVIKGYDPFAVAPDLTKAYKEFLDASTLTARPVHAWLQPYLTWRWQVRATYGSLNQMRLASAEDREVLSDHNNRLIKDADLMARTAMNSAIRAVVSVFDIGARVDNVRLLYLDPEARQVLANAQKAKPTPQVIASFFDNYVHDSLAGFNKPTLELTGYWRYRKGFIGDDQTLVVSNDRPAADTQSEAA